MSAGPATHVVLLTPQGRGAIASLLVAGPTATALVGQCFHPASGAALPSQPLGKIIYGRWQSANTGEEVIVCRRDAARVEIHCHGGAVASRAIIEALVVLGAQVIPWQQWIRQTADDPLVAAAETALAAASTERAAATLWDQRLGALSGALDQIAALVESRDAPAAIARVDELLAWAPLGLHLVEPWHVVLAGRPNVGKSSLINALLGYPRAIVHPTPGTTRDIVTAAAAIEGWPVELTDTAGLHDATDPLETAGMQLAGRRLAAADLVVLVFDASSRWSAADESLLGDWPAALCVLNKCDLVTGPDRGPDPRHCVRASALLSEGIYDLAREIGRRLVPRAPVAGQAVPFLAEQVDALARIRKALVAVRFDRAAGILAARDSWSDAPC